MAVREFTGPRLIPTGKHPYLHDKTKSYEQLLFVQDENGNCFLSMKPVPPGIDLPDPIETGNEYWLYFSNWSPQVAEYARKVEEYHSEVQLFDERITDETEARETAVQNIYNNQWIEPANLTDEAKELHASGNNYFQKAYINKTTGDDETGEINNPELPFKTLEAACSKLNLHGPNFDFRFQTPGTYYFPMKIFEGASIHFRTTECETPGDVLILPPNDLPEGGFYFYDTHVNFMGTEENRIKFDMGTDRLIEIEGSTLWASYTDFVCSYLYLIQGSGYINNSTLRGYLYTFFASVRLRGFVIDNQTAYPAIRFSCGTLRIEPIAGGTDSLYIKKNNNSGAVNHSAIYLESSHGVFYTTVGGDQNTGYDRFVDARSSLVTATDEWVESWNALGNARVCQFASLTVRVNANTVLNGN